MAIKEEKLRALAEKVGEEQAREYDKHHTALGGNITKPFIKCGIIHACRGPTFPEMQFFRKDYEKDVAQAHKVLIGRIILMGKSTVENHPGMLINLSNSAIALTEEDEEFDIEGN